MNIIEKLGLNTPELRTVEDCLAVFELAGMNRRYSDDVFDKAQKLKRILDEKNELLGDLIESIINPVMHNWHISDTIKLIEKIADMPWEKIKELS